jgi:hypothetical protein
MEKYPKIVGKVVEKVVKSGGKVINRGKST